MKNKILITGGSGLLAVNWALATRERFSVVLGLHNRKIVLDRIEGRHVDIDSVDLFTALLEVISPQLIIHTAGLTNVEECEAKPDLAHQINVNLAENIAIVCERMRIPLVHISTDHLFDGKIEMIDENQPVAPQNVYAQTKAEAESRVLNACSRSLVVRTNFFGWGTTYRKSFSDIIVDSLRKGTELILFEDAFYTPILIETLVNAVHDLIDNRAYGIYHVTGSERMSKYEFGQKIANVFKLDSKLIRSGKLKDRKDLVHRPFDMSLSNQKATEALGRKLGDVNEYLEKLFMQEKLGLYREVRNL